MKITIQIDGEEVASAVSIQRSPPMEIPEKAATLRIEDAGPAPSIIPAIDLATMFSPIEREQAAFSEEMAIDCGEAPKEFQSKVVSEWQAGKSLTERTGAKDAGKAVQQ